MFSGILQMICRLYKWLHPHSFLWVHKQLSQLEFQALLFQSKKHLKDRSLQQPQQWPEYHHWVQPQLQVLFIHMQLIEWELLSSSLGASVSYSHVRVIDRVWELLSSSLGASVSYSHVRVIDRMWELLSSYTPLSDQIHCVIIEWMTWSQMTEIEKWMLKERGKKLMC